MDTTSKVLLTLLVLALAPQILEGVVLVCIVIAAIVEGIVGRR